MRDHPVFRCASAVAKVKWRTACSCVGARCRCWILSCLAGCGRRQLDRLLDVEPPAGMGRGLSRAARHARQSLEADHPSDRASQHRRQSRADRAVERVWKDAADDWRGEYRVGRRGRQDQGGVRPRGDVRRKSDHRHSSRRAGDQRPCRHERRSARSRLGQPLPAGRHALDHHPLGWASDRLCGRRKPGCRCRLQGRFRN